MVFIAIGAQQSRGLGCDGEELALHGLDFLERVAKGDPPAIGGRVAVIGGGNTAMDVARSAIRLGALTATAVVLEAREHMTAHASEIQEAEEEGTRLVPLRSGSCRWPAWP